MTLPRSSQLLDALSDPHHTAVVISGSPAQVLTALNAIPPQDRPWRYLHVYTWTGQPFAAEPLTLQVVLNMPGDIHTWTQLLQHSHPDHLRIVTTSVPTDESHAAHHDPRAVIFTAGDLHDPSP